MVIKAGFLVSYDYNLIKFSLPRVYPFLDEIILCVDIERKTWAGEKFEVNEEFWDWIKTYDKDNKITIYEDGFFVPEKSTMECETRERKMLSDKMGKCDWYIQIDADEYFIDFEIFVNKLKNFKTTDPVTIYCRVAPLFKETANGFLLIDTATETLPFVTNQPNYTSGRACHKNNYVNITWEDIVIHQSWARSEEEIKTKLDNWGHKTDFDTNSYYNLWKVTDENNYIYLNDFHPLDRITWSKLILVEQKDINQIMENPNELLKLYNKGSSLKKKKKFFRFWS